MRRRSFTAATCNRFAAGFPPLRPAATVADDPLARAAAGECLLRTELIGRSDYPLHRECSFGIDK